MVDLYKDNHPFIVNMKSTQNGASEWLIVWAWNRASKGRRIFWALPTYVLKNTFVKERFNTSLYYSDYYRSFQLLTKELQKSEDSTLVHIGHGAINFVGSNSSSAFTSFSADDVIIDEEDECDPDNLKMAPERQSACPDPAMIRVGNPKHVGLGIDYQYSQSDKRKWHQKCDRCNFWYNPNFFRHIVRDKGDNNFVLLDTEWTRDSERDIYMICENCGKPVDKFADGEWVAETKSDIHGYHISKLFSSAVTNKFLVNRFEEGLVDPTSMARFYNGDLGLPYTEKGARIDYSMLDDCIEDYSMPDRCDEICAIGVDVGSRWHVRINQLLHNGQDRAVFIDSVQGLSDIKELLTRYNVKCGIIDAKPELTEARRFTKLNKGFYRCNYIESLKDRPDKKSKMISVDRTSSLDNVKAKIALKTQILPRDIKQRHPLLIDTMGVKVSEYYYHMTASTRVYDEKRNVYKWMEGSKADHFFHAENYCNLAKRLLKR
jgi:hypothetical protein